MGQISLFSRATSPRVGTVSNELLNLFLAFQIIDQTILPILVVTFLFTSAKRLPTLVNVCFTWIFTGIISSLLLYTGTHVGPEPPKMTCVTQAALLDAVPPMTSVAALALMIQTYQSIRKKREKRGKLFTYALVVAPYFVFFCFAITAALLATRHPEDVTRERRFFYCSFKSKVFSNVFAMFTAVVLLITKGYLVAIGVFIYRNWRTLRQSGSLDIQTLSRVILFGSYIFLTLILSILSFVAPRSPVPDLFTASVGTVLAFSLGTQPDIYRVWFRRPLPTPPHIVHAPDDLVSVDVEKLHKEFGSNGDSMDDPDSVYRYTTSAEVVKLDPGNRDRVIDISAKFKELRPR